jgi:hypothetical protein
MVELNKLLDHGFLPEKNAQRATLDWGEVGTCSLSV